MQALRHIMVDLETRGTTPGCIPLSIGAVEWQPHTGAIAREFYRVVDTQSCKDVYLFEEAGTMAWWSKQGAEARQVLTASEDGSGAHITDALREWYLWCLDGLSDRRNLRIWGNGAAFDYGILSAASAACHIEMPDRYGDRCYRTIKNLGELFGGPELPKMARTGTHHNALDDAKSQALHMTAILRHISETW